MSPLISSAWSLVALTIASTLTQNWQKEASNKLNAFVMYEDKLTEILTNPQAQAVRFYLGWYNLNGITNIPKIMAVGVDGNGNDIIVQSEVDSKIYNTFLPCPTVCPDKSPLLHREFLEPSPAIPLGDHNIPFSEAVRMTSAWQQENTIRSIYTSKEDLIQLFAHYNQGALRMYFGKDADNTLGVLIVGVNENGEDLVNQGIFNNTSAICLSDQVVCDMTSPLYHN